MLTDIEIAKSCKMVPIIDIARSLGIQDSEIELYGWYKAKIDLSIFDRLKSKKNGKLILVTAMNPTPLGEGKTTVTVGLGQALNRIGKKSIICLREPSLGPVMGIKGGAAGGGYSQVVPMEDINLHFTGDIHAVTSANNFLSACIDNHIHQGNELNIDPRKIVWKRAIDMNDRALRQIIVGLGGYSNGFVREDGFVITAASEIMAILCLANNLKDLKNRLGKIVIGYNYEGKPIFSGDLMTQGAMTTLLKEAIKPNLVQTIENTPAFIHGGPFANIAHGCNSIIATKMALKLSDYCITEAGFGADLGAEKFFNIKCRYGNLKPDLAVIVVTIKALKYNGGVNKEALNKENIEAIKEGFENLKKHIKNINKFGINVIVAINRFSSDTEKEISFLKNMLKDYGVIGVIADVYSKGGEGGLELANAVIDEIEKNKSDFRFLYDDETDIKSKIEKISTEIYGAKEVVFSPKALKAIADIENMKLVSLPVCMAKTQYSLSDNPKMLGRPQNFSLNVSEVTLSQGAGFVVAMTGEIMKMPGLPKKPVYTNIDIDKNGYVTGLF